MEKNKIENLEIQQTYAKILFLLSNLTLVFLCVSFFLYVSGILEPHISFEELSQHWGKPLDEFLEATKAPTGWEWSEHLHQGDYLSLLGMVLLAGITSICYFVLVVDFTKNKKSLFLTIAVAESIIILIAASNILQFVH